VLPDVSSDAGRAVVQSFCPQNAAKQLADNSNIAGKSADFGTIAHLAAYGFAVPLAVTGGYHLHNARRCPDRRIAAHARRGRRCAE
jgi:hypothetical protein